MPLTPNALRSRGFTLVELCVTTAIAATLAAAAVPSLSGLTQRLRMQQAESELMLTLARARNEAVSSGRRAAIAPRADNDWRTGWRMFSDLDDNGELGNGEPVLMESPAPHPSLSLTAHFGNMQEVVLSYGDAGFVRRPGSNALLMGRMVLSDGTRNRVFCFGATRVRVVDGTTCS